MHLYFTVSALAPSFIVWITWLSGTLGEKQNRLQVLGFFPQTGLQQPLAGMRDVILMMSELVNNRSDILPDYQLEMRFEDEAVGFSTAANLVKYSRDFEEAKTLPYYQCPLVIGTWYSAGCKAIGPILPYLQMIDLSIGCAAPAFVDHSAYPNLYLMLRTGHVKALAILHLMRDIGNWNRVGLLANSGNVNDYGAALFFQSVAMDIGMDVPLFTMATDVDDDVVDSLVNLDLRIVVFFAGTNTLAIKLLCLAYNHGMKGSRYVFILNYSAANNPLSYPDTFFPGCTRAIYIEQLQQTLWVGPAYQYRDPSIISEWGFSMTDFDDLLDRQLYKNSSMRPSDYSFRYLYHDAALLAFHTLHEAEQTLRKKNLSLRDYQTYPEAVVKVVNESLMTTKVAGIRLAGKLGFSKKGIIESALETIVHWSLQTADSIVATVRQQEAELTFESFSTSQVIPIKWITKNGLPPLDSRILHVSVAKLPLAISRVIYTIAGLTIAGHVIAIAVTALRVLKGEQCVPPISKLMAYVASVVTAISAILFALSGDFNNKSIWIAAIILLTAGVSAQTGINCMRCRYRVIIDRNRPSVATSALHVAGMSSSTSNLNHTHNHYYNFQPLADKLIAGGSFLFLAINCAILAIWFGADPSSCHLKMIHEAIYDPILDTSTETFAIACGSRHTLPFALTLCGVQVGALLIAAYFCYKTYQQLKRYPAIFTTKPVEFVYIRMAVTNAVALLFGFVPLVAIFRDPISQRIVVAFGGLFMSAAELFLLFGPLIYPKVMGLLHVRIIAVPPATPRPF